jgi:hypothetical protein
MRNLLKACKILSAMVLLVAGFDTTSMTLSFMVYHLSKAWFPGLLQSLDCKHTPENLVYFSWFQKWFVIKFTFDAVFEKNII